MRALSHGLEHVAWRDGLVTQWMLQEIARIRSVIDAGVVVLAVVMVVAVWQRTRALIPVIGAVIVAAFVIWGVHNVATLESKIGEEFNSAPSPSPPTNQPPVGSSAELVLA